MSADSQSSRLGHESNKLPLKGILWCLAGFIAAAIIIHLVLIASGTMLGNSYKRFGHIYQIQPNQVPQYPSPALQSNPSIDLQTYRSRAEHDLNTYAWIDRSRGIVRIPIERAMNLLASKGLPVRPSIQDGPTELDMQKGKAAADSAKATQQQQTRP
jgi:hypothetical protein